MSGPDASRSVPCWIARIPVCLVVLLLAAVGGASDSWARPSLATEGETPVVGVNDHPVWRRWSRDVAFDLINASNAGAVRIDMPWDVIEPSRGRHDWTRLHLIDEFVQRAVAADIEVLMVPTDSPSWASGTSDRRAPPRTDADYAGYVEFLVTRYRGQVSAFEIWNEPNGGWAWTDPDPVRYASLLKAAYSRAKTIDPSVTILAPSLSGPDQGAYLDAFYAQGTKDYFDVLSMHGYWWNIDSWPIPYSDGTDPDMSIFGQFNTRIMPILEKYGDEDKRVWWTETGVPTSGSGTSTDDQAAAVDEAFSAWRADVIPTMDRLYWYTMFDTIGKGSEQNFGLVDIAGTSATQPRSGDFVPKPAYERFQEQAAMTRPVSVTPAGAGAGLLDADLLFEVDSARLADPETAVAAIERFVASLRLQPGQRVVVVGHTSYEPGGGPNQGMALSQERADVVAGLLADAGVSPRTIEARGAGPNEPLVQPPTDPLNRAATVAVTER